MIGLSSIAGCGGSISSDSDAGARPDGARPDEDGGGTPVDAQVDAFVPTSCDGVTCSDHGTCVEAGGVHCECDEGFVASGLACVEEVVPGTGDLFVDLPATGSVRATLHPTDMAAIGSAVTVSFGAPFPRGVVTDLAMIRVTDAAGAELPAHVAELARWRSLDGEAGFVESVRSALVQVSITLASREPVELSVQWGTARTRTIASPGDAWADWAPISGSTFFPDEYPAGADVREPRVYVTFPPDWLSACILRTRTEPFGTDDAWAFFDDVYPEFARTAANDVDPRVTAGNRIDYVGQGEPWLFDRALTFFGVYVRSGDVTWLRHAHRAAQFYGAHITAEGFFDLADGDLKYAYGGPLFVDLALSGDTRHRARITAVASAGEDWNETYTAGTGFWTERHQTYALLAALSAWETTGERSHATRAIRVATETFRMAREPVSGWTAQGCVLHTSESHEGDGDPSPICSPWMSALLADAVFRYYVHSEDPAALEYLAGLGDFVRTYGSVDEGEGLVPYYLASSEHQRDPDIEHACDVAGLVARAAWSRTALGGDASMLSATARALLASCRANLESWHRPAGPASGLAEWRLSPARKLNWWFGTTLDMPWLIAP